ncbi:MAG: hypothetical protein A2270_07310 [Elusimicrobia bacterium RIFOXYA12_FULL_51_18]|nr:MAG: hypothetical protein A2270_07310 [Elusimicrobia bacterium RIFOXYA12_FULL_51_18]OGS28490.1 MAG: hypothetical protein A2218_05615 [Elusimicrobia bacterium RIFOXYA2_FULL_53_38]
MTSKQLNIVLLVTDGHGYYTGNMDWGTKEFKNLKDRLDNLKLVEKGFVKFSNVMSPAVSTIMSVESIMSGIYAAKSHKLHWREWPKWDIFNHPVLSSFLKQLGYSVTGFSYLLNSENWLPCINCYNPELYKNYPSIKRDTHSHEAVLAAVKHYFANAFKGDKPGFFIVHSIFIFDMWDELMKEFSSNGFTEENTIFILTADHYFPKNFGRQWLLGERNGSLLGHHIDLTEYNVRVPLYLRYPGSKGFESSELVSGVDIAPTLVDLLGVSAQWPAKFDGVSLVPLLKGDPIPARMLRADNIYPYQIGEQQGRVTAIRKGKYKYVFRPDPPSSYIAYRLDEDWSVVLEREEFYDIDADPQEARNLIHNESQYIQEEVLQCREFLKKTNQDITIFHLSTLREAFQRNDLANKLFSGKKTGNLLCIQSTHNVVFESILRVLQAELPGWNIDIVIKAGNSLQLPGIRKSIHYFDNNVYQKDKFIKAMDSNSLQHYDIIINTSNIPMGDYSAVYDPVHHPVGDFIITQEIMNCLKTDMRASLCLDMTYGFANPYSVSGNRKFWQLYSPRKLLFAFLAYLMHRFEPELRKIKKALPNNNQFPKINQYLSERIIVTKKNQCNE